ncbi:MAG: winged helix-turn-helix transcriptional regulator [Burkholderiales bacterium]
MDAILRVLMGPWTSYILWQLRSNGPLRFGALKRNMPSISSKVLTERLRKLEDAGLVYRHYVPTVPPQVTYGLADRGLQLGSTLDALNRIGRRWQHEDRKEADKQLEPLTCDEPKVNDRAGG